MFGIGDIRGVSKSINIIIIYFFNFLLVSITYQTFEIPIPDYPMDKPALFLANDLYNACEKHDCIDPMLPYTLRYFHLHWPGNRYTVPLNGYDR